MTVILVAKTVKIGAFIRETSAENLLTTEKSSRKTIMQLFERTLELLLQKSFPILPFEVMFFFLSAISKSWKKSFLKFPKLKNKIKKLK